MPETHVERPTRLAGGRTYCACGAPWPCERAETATAGPFGSEREARAAALRLAGPPDGPLSSILSAEQSLQLLTGATVAAGVELGDYDQRILVWLAGFGDATCAVIAGLIARAAEGKTGSDGESG